MTTQTRTDTQALTRPSDRRIDYSFDAVPKQARELLEQGQISRTDYAVLIELLKFQKAFRGSCWTTKSKIAEALGISTKTVQRSYRALSDAGLIRMSEVARPGFEDPDEPKNRTGYRIHFLFVDTMHPAGPEDRRPPADRQTQACSSGGEDTNVLPPQDTNVLPPRTPMSPNIRRTSSF